MLVAKGGARLKPDEGIKITGFNTDAGPATVGLATRFQEIGLANRVPQDPIFEVRCPGSSLDDAVARGSALATSLAPLISSTINAFVDVPQAHLSYEASPGRRSRRFWQTDVQLGTHTLTPTQIVRFDLLIPFLEAIFTSREQQRLGVAISYYHAALRDWTTAGQPLALMHLYPALEALGGAVERAERVRLGLADKEAHARYRRIDVTKSNWREVLLGWVRRDVICKGDQPTYKAAHEASNGLEHDSLDMPSIRAMAQQVTPELFDYVRDGVLDLLNLEAEIRERLGKLRVLDVTPLRMQMRGVLIGDVADADQLGFETDPYPRMDPQLILDELTYQSDGRLTVSPRYTYTVRIASGVQFTPSETATPSSPLHLTGEQTELPLVALGHHTRRVRGLPACTSRRFGQRRTDLGGYQRQRRPTDHRRCL
ncbi:MAG: hypothetical protein ACJ72M_12195 [Propionibacteriaceae bacterium]